MVVYSPRDFNAIDPIYQSWVRGDSLSMHDAGESRPPGAEMEELKSPGLPGAFRQLPR